VCQPFVALARPNTSSCWCVTRQWNIIMSQAMMMKVVMSLPDSVQQLMFKPKSLCIVTIPMAFSLAYIPHFCES